MGMFDTVRFRYRMPDGVTGTDFQTDDPTASVNFTRFPLKAACFAGWVTVREPIPVLTGC